MRSAKCNLCGKRITLVHPTKTNPLGRLHDHKFGTRKCWGTPLPHSVKEKS